MNRKILLLVQEEYPNPCDSDLHFDIFKLMDLGEVVKVITPPPPRFYKQIQNFTCGAFSAPAKASK
jgi:hypothetical protein